MYQAYCIVFGSVSRRMSAKTCVVSEKSDLFSIMYLGMY